MPWAEELARVPDWDGVFPLPLFLGGEETAPRRRPLGAKSWAVGEGQPFALALMRQGRSVFLPLTDRVALAAEVAAARHRRTSPRKEAGRGTAVRYAASSAGVDR